jgi:magnesium-transporting ATPase (P-type)
MRMMLAADAADKPDPEWYAMPAEDCLAHVVSNPNGLSKPEVARRLQVYGPKRLAPPVRRTTLQRLLIQFHNILIYVLLVSAALAALLGHGIDAAVILGVVIANAVVGFIQEGKSEKALEAIRRMIAPMASVLRDGKRQTVDASDLVPGDILVLEAGDRVTADVRLIRARQLRIDEAILTGESVPVEKTTEPVTADASVGDRRSMGYSGTLVTAGQGLGLVVASGMATELGRISELMGTVEELTTPLIRHMNAFARQLTMAILALSAATFAFAYLVREYPLAEAFMAVVGMAVAAIPEGLPAVMTVTLAIGVQRMAARNAIIRRLPAVETLGSVSFICSDKTGTLTKNEMTVRAVVVADGKYEIGGVGYAPDGSIAAGGTEIDPETKPPLMVLARAALLCNNAALRQSGTNWIVEGDPMEGALVSLAMKAGFHPDETREQFPRADEIPFDAAHRFMATLNRRHDDGAFICIKGAPEQVLGMCEYQLGSAGDEPLEADKWLAAVDALAAKGQRVLAIATKPVPDNQDSLAFSHVKSGVVLIGLVGLIDPPREEAIAAVRECHEAGICVKMITGDHRATASAIALQLGLPNAGNVATGQDLDALDGPAFRHTAIEINVFARTSPEDKLRLVEALQANGAVVAMTGDGVNDAPALKRADVGVAMGSKGTEAAKEASDMVLADDNFASIVAAVREGRTIYDNLVKVIGWTLPTSGGETFTIVAAILLGLTLPITPVQILWINMVTAVALGLVLAFEPAEPDVMRRPPRPADAPILSGFLVWRIVFVSLLFVLGAFGTFFWATARGLDIDTARTMVVNAIVVMEIFYLFSVRYVHATSLTFQGLLGTPAVLIGVSGVVLLQLAFTYAPFMNRLFGTMPVGIGEGMAIIALGFALLVILELEKFVRRWSLRLLR